MTKQLKDLFQQFSTMETSAQLEKIKEIRHHRSIERPAAAVKRVKKERKQSVQKQTKIATLIQGMTAEQRAEFVRKLTEGT